MDSTSNEDISLQTPKEAMGNGAIEFGSETEGSDYNGEDSRQDSESPNPNIPPAPSLPPPTWQPTPQAYVPEDTTPPQPEVSANGDDSSETGDIRYKLMQIYKPKESESIDTSAPLPELNHSTPSSSSTIYPALSPEASADVGDSKEDEHNEHTTEADFGNTNEEEEEEEANENTTEVEEEDQQQGIEDTREDCADEPREKTDLGDPAQVAQIVAAMDRANTDSGRSTPQLAQVDGSESAVDSDTRCSTPRTAETEESQNATNSDTRCSTPGPAESPNVSRRDSSGSASHPYPIDVCTDENDDETAENCNSLEKPTRSTEDDADTLPPPAYSAASTVVNGQTSKNKDDFVDTKLTIDEKPKLSNKDKPNSYMKLSVCACIFNVLIGIIAITYSFRSKDAWKEGKREKAWSNGINALCCSLFGILSVIAIIGIVLWLEVFTNKSGL